MIEVRDLKKHFAVKKFMKPAQSVKALDGVSFSLAPKRTLAVVGESGCGKSTLAKVLLQIEKPSGGDFSIGGKSFSQIDPKEFRKKIQMIFQDPYSSINPRKKAWQIISEPLKINEGLSNEACRARAIELMAQEGLRAEMADRYPHMFSGGQRQRLGIARALALRPEILICDEPISALDVSIQAQVINLLIDLQDQYGLSYIFISHDLSVVRHLADEVLVMYLGKAVEQGDRKAIFEKPIHPYTRALLSATPDIHGAKSGTKQVIQGEPPSPLNPPSGCAFHKRCAYATELCSKEIPILREFHGRQVSCHHAEKVAST